jgi:hypothetical protein
VIQTYNVEMCYVYMKKINCKIESKEEEKRFDFLHRSVLDKKLICIDFQIRLKFNPSKDAINRTLEVRVK